MINVFCKKVILRFNAIEQNTGLNHLKGYTKTSGSWAATKFGVK